MPYVKLDTAILDSTLWLENSDTCKVFMTMLAMARPCGTVEATAPGIARRANLSISVVRAALETLEAPDPDSRTLADEGRRVKRVEGGYFITNYELYRNKDHTAAERKRRERAARKAAEAREVTRDGCDTTRDVTGVTPDVTQAEAEAEAEAPCAPSGARRNGGNGRAHHFDEFWDLYPRKRDKKKAREVWIRKRLDERAHTICQDVRHRQRLDDQWKRGYIPLPTTYLNGERWEDEFSQPQQGAQPDEPWYKRATNIK